MGGNRLPRYHAPFSGGAVVMSRTVLFSVLGLGSLVLGWVGTGLPLWEGCVVPFDDCEVYSFNGTQYRYYRLILIAVLTIKNNLEN